MTALLPASYAPTVWLTRGIANPAWPPSFGGVRGSIRLGIGRRQPGFDKSGGDVPETGKRRAFRSRSALRDLRLRAGLTEQALAARLGVTSLTIKAWEKGERPQPHREWLLKLAAALGCSVADLRPGKSVAAR
jgi:DNA-binding XRE family transcriptional regulator